MSFPVSFYIEFPVKETLEIDNPASIQTAINKMMQDYQSDNNDGFSYRILLPRDEKHMSLARKLGFSFQSELLLAMRKKNIRPRFKEFRYIHDENHFGWLIINPEIYEKTIRSSDDNKE